MVGALTAREPQAAVTPRIAIDIPLRVIAILLVVVAGNAEELAARDGLHHICLGAAP